MAETKKEAGDAPLPNIKDLNIKDDTDEIEVCTISRLKFLAEKGFKIDRSHSLNGRITNYNNDYQIRNF